jgi:hypothetical protein
LLLVRQLVLPKFETQLVEALCVQWILLKKILVQKMGTVDENGRIPDDVIQVFLANDIAKNVRVDPKTTIQVTHFSHSCFIFLS